MPPKGAERARKQLIIRKLRFKNGETQTIHIGIQSLDGETLASGNVDGMIILWDVRVKSWMNIACQKVGRNLTKAEWTRYIGDEFYRKSCEQ